MKNWSNVLCVVAGLMVIPFSGCKKEPCEAALVNMKKIAESMPEKGGKPPTDEEEKVFLAACAKWPEEIKACMADASDEKSAETCFNKLTQVEGSTAAPAAKPAEDKPAAEGAEPKPE